MSQLTQAIRILPWGEEIYMEVSINKKSSNRFYARHGRTSEGKDYIEFSKFGPKPNTDNETYSQKLRIFDPLQWAAMQYYMEEELADSIGWDLKTAQAEFESGLKDDQQLSSQVISGDGF